MYLGWDIGIKNLAYCLIKKLDKSPDPSDKSQKNILLLSGNYYQIVDWDVVNIIPRVSSYIKQRGELVLQQRPIVKCKAILGPGYRPGRNGKKARSRPVSPASARTSDPNSKADPHYCNKTALVCLSQDPVYDTKIPGHKHGYQGFCGTHFKRANINKEEYLDAKLTNCLCHVMVTDNKTAESKRCGTKAMYIDRAHYFRGYCKKHYNTIIREGDKKGEDFLKVVRGKKSTQLDITHLGTALFDELENRPHLHQNSKCVLLENQPVLTNPTMKSIQMFVHSYFMDYGMRNEKGAVQEIHCYSASKKLDLIKHVPAAIYENIKTEAKTIPKKYGRYKRIAIRLCEHFLGQSSTIGIRCDDMYAKFKESKKRDDLADSLLMTLHYLEREHLKALQNDNALLPLLQDTCIISESKPLINSDSEEECNENIETFSTLPSENTPMNTTYPTNVKAKEISRKPKIKKVKQSEKKLSGDENGGDIESVDK